MTRVDPYNRVRRKAPNVWGWLHIAAATGNVQKLRDCYNGEWEYPPNGVRPCDEIDHTDNVGVL